MHQKLDVILQQLCYSKISFIVAVLSNFFLLTWSRGWPILFITFLFYQTTVPSIKNINVNSLIHKIHCLVGTSKAPDFLHKNIFSSQFYSIRKCRTHIAYRSLPLLRRLHEDDRQPVEVVGGAYSPQTTYLDFRRQTRHHFEGRSPKHRCQSCWHTCQRRRLRWWDSFLDEINDQCVIKPKNSRGVVFWYHVLIPLMLKYCSRKICP